MKIADIRTIAPSCKVDPPYASAAGVQGRRAGLLVEVETDTGIVGIGESGMGGGVTADVIAKATGNYVNSILAGYEARRSGYDEALLLDVQGFVAEGSGENVFMARGGVVKTPLLTDSLPGITRDAVMKILADQGVNLTGKELERDALQSAYPAE